MKKIAFLLLTMVFMFTVGSLQAQKIKEGSLAALKGQTVVNIQYDWSKMSVGKFKSEQAYVEDGIADRNKKKPGTGDEWAVKWNSDKAERFQPMFEKELNDQLKNCGLSGTMNASDAQYTLIVITTFMEQGFQSGVGVSKPATINMVVDLVETANPGNVLAKIVYDKVPSVNMMGYDFDTGSRVMSCYDRAGGNIGKLICKNLK